MVLIENLLRRLAQLAAKSVESVDLLESGLRMDRPVTCASVGALGNVVSNNN